MDNLPPEFILVPLQLEQDTNIQRHVSPHLRRMQAVVDTISRAGPTVPVIYKQHPVDAQRGGRHLRLRLRRKQDILMPHRWGNIHQVLKTGSCKAIISLNSNVVHDGFLWDVPAVVLGRNIWPSEGVSPFLLGLPRDWSELDDFYRDPTITACREAYIHTIMTHQWYRADAKDLEKVQALLEEKFEDVRQGRSPRRRAGGKLIRMPQRPLALPAKPGSGLWGEVASPLLLFVVYLTVSGNT